jgi:hypothetical protein
MKYLNVFFVASACMIMVSQAIIVTGRAEVHVPKTEVDLEFLVTV